HRDNAKENPEQQDQPRIREHRGDRGRRAKNSASDHRAHQQGDPSPEPNGSTDVGENHAYFLARRSSAMAVIAVTPAFSVGSGTGANLRECSEGSGRPDFSAAA